MRSATAITMVVGACGVIAAWGAIGPFLGGSIALATISSLALRTQRPRSPLPPVVPEDLSVAAVREYRRQHPRATIADAVVAVVITHS